jgi:hypothetical protein
VHLVLFGFPLWGQWSERQTDTPSDNNKEIQNKEISFALLFLWGRGVTWFGTNSARAAFFRAILATVAIFTRLAFRRTRTFATSTINRNSTKKENREDEIFHWFIPA